jgi:hypothetical protein
MTSQSRTFGAAAATIQTPIVIEMNQQGLARVRAYR